MATQLKKKRTLFGSIKTTTITFGDTVVTGAKMIDSLFSVFLNYAVQYKLTTKWECFAETCEDVKASLQVNAIGWTDEEIKSQTQAAIAEIAIAFNIPVMGK